MWCTNLCREQDVKKTMFYCDKNFTNIKIIMEKIIFFKYMKNTHISSSLEYSTIYKIIR